MQKCVFCGFIIGGFETAGNFKTQVVSNLVMSLGICLVLFSSWQYTQELPTCCHWPHHNTSSAAAVFSAGASHGSSNCSALHVNTVVDRVNFHLPPNLNLALAILGLTVRKFGVIAFSSECVIYSCLQLDMAVLMQSRVSLLQISSLKKQ